MSRPIAGINKFRYGVCGYHVDGVILKNGTKLKDLRIYKQRSINMFDVLDPRTNIVYQKLQISGYDINNRVLDYSLSDDDILNAIPKNSFFVRGYNDELTHTGFVIRFLLNKIVLSSGVIYDMYTPTCSASKQELGTVIVNSIFLNDDTVSGSIAALQGNLIETGMVVTLTTPSGEIYTTTVINRNFTFNDVVLDSIGQVSITITSPYYYDRTIVADILDPSEETDYTTQYSVSASQFVQDGSLFSFILPETTHERGSELVIQIQTPNGVIFMPEVRVDSTGNIKVLVPVAQDLDILILGTTSQRIPFSKQLSWIMVGSVYEMQILKSEHNKENLGISVYDGNNLCSTELQIDIDDNVILRSTDVFSGKVVISGK